MCITALGADITAVRLVEKAAGQQHHDAYARLSGQVQETQRKHVRVRSHLAQKLLISR